MALGGGLLYINAGALAQAWQLARVLIFFILGLVIDGHEALVINNCSTGCELKQSGIRLHLKLGGGGRKLGICHLRSKRSAPD